MGFRCGVLVGGGAQRCDLSQSFIVGPPRWPLVPTPEATSSGSSGASSSPWAPRRQSASTCLRKAALFLSFASASRAPWALIGRDRLLHQGLAPLHARGRVGQEGAPLGLGEGGHQGVEGGLVVGAHQAGHELLLGGHGVELLAQFGRLVDVRRSRLALLLLQDGPLLGPGLLRLLLLGSRGPAVDLGLDAALLLLAGGGRGPGGCGLRLGLLLRAGRATGGGLRSGLLQASQRGRAFPAVRSAGASSRPSSGGPPGCRWAPGGPPPSEPKAEAGPGCGGQGCGTPRVQGNPGAGPGARGERGWVRSLRAPPLP